MTDLDGLAERDIEVALRVIDAAARRVERKRYDLPHPARISQMMSDQDAQDAVVNAVIRQAVSSIRSLRLECSIPGETIAGEAA